LFQFDLDKPWNYVWYFYERGTPPPLPLYQRAGARRSMPPLCTRSPAFLVKWNKTEYATYIRNYKLKLTFRRKHQYCNCWNSINYRTVSCNSYWSLIYQIRNACNWNRKQLQNLTLSALTTCYWKNLATHSRKAITIVSV